MRILAVSDIHGSGWGVKQIHSWVDELDPDLLVVCGDITHFGPVSFARELFESISVRALAVPGNCDPVGITSLLDERGINLHMKNVKVMEETFVGYGGSDPTPFDTLFEVPDNQIEDSLSRIMKPNSILITHAPPYGILDFAGRQVHAGSQAIRKVVDDFEPKLSVFGHIHEARGIHEGKTLFINCGSARRGHGALIDVGESITATLLG